MQSEDRGCFSLGRKGWADTREAPAALEYESMGYNIFYIIGVIVVVALVLKLLGLY